MCPLRGDIMFHVTNKGRSSSLGGATGDGCCERRLLKLKKEVLEEDFEVLFKAALEEVVERVDGVEEEEEAEAGEGPCRRDMLGRDSFEGTGWASSSSGSSSSPSLSSSVSSTPSISLSSSRSSPSCISGSWSSSSFSSVSAALDLVSASYRAHRSSTCRYPSGSRSSRSAVRISKQ